MLAVNIVCVGDVDSRVVDRVSAGLTRELGAAVTVLDPLPLPADAYDSHRHQYSSADTLRRLSGWQRPNSAPPSGEAASRPVLLAITSADLHVPGLNFVFGEARPADRTCIISLARLGHSYEGAPVPSEFLLERALKEAVHEIGHVLGLGHCGRRSCAMFFSNTIRDTDAKSHTFCPSCRRRLTL
jgi:archaemetzincin